MQEALTYYLRTKISFTGDWGRQPASRSGNVVGPAPSGLYACKPGGPNDYAFVLCVTQPHVDRCLLAIDRPDLLSDERFNTEEARFANSEALRAEIAEWMAARTKHEVMKHLGEAGVPCAATLDTSDLYDDPHLNERGFVHTLEHPDKGPVRMLGFPPRLSDSDFEYQAPPGLGEHTDTVLEDELGIARERIDKLRASGAIA